MAEYTLHYLENQVEVSTLASSKLPTSAMFTCLPGKMDLRRQARLLNIDVIINF
jgi:hypothetical protein